MIVTAAALAPLVLKSLKQAGMAGTLLLEPCRRNTAPAIALAIEAGARPGEPMLVLASDHYIADAAAFRRAVQESEGQARAGRIITFGVEPDSPHTGYGYIEKGAPLGDGTFAIEKFIEKPKQDVAFSLLAKGCLWNSGNFMFMPEVMQAEIAKHQSGIATVVGHAAQRMTRSESDGSTILSVERDIFAEAPDISIDYAVLERSALGACKPVTYRWSDMGTWNALWEHHVRDERQNAVLGPATLLNTEGALVVSEAQHVAVVGMSNVAVVATPDAILVAPARRRQRVVRSAQISEGRSENILTGLMRQAGIFSSDGSSSASGGVSGRGGMSCGSGAMWMNSALAFIRFHASRPAIL